MKLPTKARNALPKGDFGLPAERKYPMPDASHAANAKSRATQQSNKGNLTPAQHAAINAKANKVLGTGHQYAPVKHTGRGLK
jgi:hypothetical protein